MVPAGIVPRPLKLSVASFIIDYQFVETEILPSNKQLLQITWPFIFAVILMLGVIDVSLRLQSSIRAYIGGESQWSKGQKEATYFINVYIQTKDEADYQKFLKSISVPLGDRQARIALDQPTRDIESARQGFLAGANHPEDVQGMIELFLLFRHTPLMEKPIAIWEEGDIHLAKLMTLAEQLHRRIQGKNEDRVALHNLMDEFNAVSLHLTPIDAFSTTLGEVSRRANRLIYGFVLFIALVLLALGTFLSRRVVLQRLASTHGLQQSERRLRATIDTSMDAVVEIDQQSIVLYWSKQAESLFGWSQEEAIGQSIGNLIIPPVHREAHLKGLRHFVSSGEGPLLNKRIEMSAIRRDGSEFPAELTISPIKWEGKYEFCAFIRDITRQKEAAEQLKNLAHYDSITGLPNRVLFQDRLSQEIKQCHRNGNLLAVLFLDLDHFKEINDTLGHDKGDVLLKETAARLHESVRDVDTVARLGGDEFVVILSHLQELDIVDSIAQRVLDKLARPFRLGDEKAYVTASIGIAIYPTNAVTHDELVRNADQAMYLAKKTGRNRFTYFTIAMQETVQIRRQLANDMRNALANNEFLVYYEPIVQLATSKIIKAEALVRWQHPTLGLIEPNEFVFIAEETGMIVNIGEWVFRTAMHQVAQWRAIYSGDFQISVNRSPTQFQENHRKFAAWGEQLSEIGLPGQSIVVEITESMLVDANEAFKNRLLEFCDAGIQVALDDFGTGYSSLSYLNKFHIDYIKIDKSFVSNLTAGSNDVVLCEAIIVMAHKLGLKVIAEGIETETQKNMLIEIGCDLGQGYYYSQALLPKEFEALLKQQPIGL